MSSLARGFAILELIAENQEQGIAFPEIVQRTGFPNSSCFMLLKQLVELQYLIFDEGTRRYFVSLKVAGLAGPVMREYNLTKIAHPFMLKLSGEVQHTCNLGVLGQDCGIYVDVLYATNYGIKLLSEVGSPFPLHCTAMGKVLLAYSSAERREALLCDPLKAYTEKTITDKQTLLAQLDAVKKNGFAVEAEEVTRGIECTSAPVFDYKNTVIAAVSIAAPIFTLEEPQERPRIRAALLAHTRLISEAFGYAGGAGTPLP